ncbi:hypothetical protein [Mucilaginibacter pedocola]|uniref:hypothetical protein n=1 Tax=Mucilaginibacter pedocola TaxID=1792845 RepID=UPI0013905004|nr:hypothetical protein [Mucilaginibacter pedocola]
MNPKAKFYYLYKKGVNIEFDKWDFDILQNEKELLKDVPVHDFIEAIENDTSSIDWSNYHLTNAKCVLQKPVKYSYSYKITKIVAYKAPDSVVQQIRADGYVPFRYKGNMSKKRYEKEMNKALERYEKEMPVEDKDLYRFSKPVFSKNRRYALISLNGSGSGCLYIFRYTDGAWAKLYKFNCWVV